MSYRSPEIITDRSGEIISQGFASFGQSIAGGLEKYASNQERLRKERDAETARMQKMKTELELEANSRAANFKANIPKTTFNERLNPIIDERLKEAADAKIALYQESDPAARAELLKTISNVDNFLLSTGEFVKQIQEEGSAWSEMKVTDINTTFGINGADDESIKNNQGLLGFISGQSDADYNLAYDPKTNSITLDAKGKVGESQWAVNGFNSVDYLGSGGELLYSIPQIKEEIINSSTKLITDDKGKLLPGISKDMEFKRISANVKDATGKIIGKKLVEGSIEEINYSAINKLIDKEVKAGVAGFQTLPPMQQNAVFKNQLNGDQANINEFIKAFPTADGQNAELQRLFTKVASEGINEQFDSYGEGDKKVYYVATSPLKEVKSPPPDKKDKLTKDDKIDLKVQENLTKADNILKWEGVDDVSSPISKSLASVDFESLIVNELGLKATPLNDKESGEQIGWTILNPDLKQWEQDILFEETIPQINKKIKVAIGSNWAGLSENPTAKTTASDLIQKYSQSN